jgi:hypothetical protein
MRLDDKDKAMLAALDEDFIVSADGETATISEDIRIHITRPADNQIQFLIEFQNLEFPVLLLRDKTLTTLGIKTDES